MRSLLRVVRKYIVTAMMVMILLLVFNMLLYGILVYIYSVSQKKTASIQEVSKQFIQTDHGYVPTKSGTRMLKKYAFGMLLDESGTIIWSNRLPKELKKRYSLSEVASFSKWYLKDYPVYTWKKGENLLVLGEKKHSIWKQQLEVKSNVIYHLKEVIIFILLGNLAVIFILCIVLGIRLYASFRPIVYGIEAISDGKEISLKEKGVTKDILQKLNQTSKRLEEQNRYIQKRDTARTKWIAGVSHDIRTPLAMVLGYGQQLGSADNLTLEQKKKAEIIVNQAIKIKNLIEDLNLTSKLEYQMQPIRKEVYRPNALIREIVSDYYNNGLEDKFTIELYVKEEVKQHQYSGDVKLLTRVFENLIGNGIRHNQDGCDICITLSHDSKKERLCLLYQDNGVGIPQEVLQMLELKSAKELEEQKEQKEKPHIMGLYIVKQIVTAHGGTLQIKSSPKDLRIAVYV